VGTKLNGHITREVEFVASEEGGYSKLRARAKDSVGTT
jgi:hypothetical protein